MSAETVGQAVEQVTAAPKMISPDTFAQVLPQHLGAEKFTRWALTLLRRPELAQVATTDAGRLSIMSALMDCASLGLEPGRTYHLVPFGGREKDGTPKPQTVTGMTDYKGEVELIWRAVQRPVIAQLVRAEDKFTPCGANVPPFHEADYWGKRGRIVGGYAYVDYGSDLYSQVIYMPESSDEPDVDSFLKHRAVSKKQDLWDKYPEPFRLKTLVHQLRKWVPWSAEVRQP